MYIKRFSVLIFCGFLLSFSSVNSETPSVLLKNGPIQGIQEKSLNGKTIYSFLGIPFAKPPVGDLRFENPIKAKPWEGTLLATEMPPMCAQFDMIKSFTNPDLAHRGSEDCLYLNVYTPKVNSSSNMAVMVFIHGGGYTAGSSHEYLPHVLLDEDIVLVVIQYRLGAFGFLSTGDDVIPGNLGLKDQSLALKWVNKNIDQFGGDSNRITIFGESAGAGSVHFHILSPLSKGLFQRAILQSGTSLCPWSTVTNQRDLAEQLAEQTNCPIDQSDYKECVKKADFLTIMDTLKKSYKWGGEPILTSPTVDGEFLLEDPLTSMINKNYNKVNVISGITRDEGGLFTALTFLGANNMKGYETNFEESAALSLFMETEENSGKLARKVYNHYIGSDKIDATSADQLTQMFGDRFFGVCQDLTSFFFAKDEDIDFFRYELVHRGEKSFMDLFQMDAEKKWVSHVDDLIYLFHGGPFFEHLPLTREDDLKVRSFIVKAWTKFAKTGNPSSASDDLGFNWPASTGSDLSYLALQVNPKMMNDSRQKIRNFWFSLKTRQNDQLLKNGYVFTKPSGKIEL